MIFMGTIPVKVSCLFPQAFGDICRIGRMSSHLDESSKATARAGETCAFHAILRTPFPLTTNDMLDVWSNVQSNSQPRFAPLCHQLCLNNEE